MTCDHYITKCQDREGYECEWCGLEFSKEQGEYVLSLQAEIDSIKVPDERIKELSK